MNLNIFNCEQFYSTVYYRISFIIFVGSKGCSLEHWKNLAYTKVHHILKRTFDQISIITKEKNFDLQNKTYRKNKLNVKKMRKFYERRNTFLWMKVMTLMNGTYRTRHVWFYGVLVAIRIISKSHAQKETLIKS